MGFLLGRGYWGDYKKGDRRRKKINVTFDCKIRIEDRLAFRFLLSYHINRFFFYQNQQLNHKDTLKLSCNPGKSKHHRQKSFLTDLPEQSKQTG